GVVVHCRHAGERAPVDGLQPQQLGGVQRPVVVEACHRGVMQPGLGAGAGAGVEAQRGGGFRVLRQVLGEEVVQQLRQLFRGTGRRRGRRRRRRGGARGGGVRRAGGGGPRGG